MVAWLDVCRFSPTAGGTTDFTFSAAVVGYQSPAAAGAVNASVYRYRAESADLSQWEVGFGAYNTATGVLSRTTVLFNSAGTTAKINFTLVPQVAIVALAEDLTFVQSGTGAVSRTLIAKAQDTFNVKDFGAVGDGSTDDTTAIAAALAAATAAGGGKVQLTRGTFIISGTLTVADSVALVGEGSSITTIKANNGTLSMIQMGGLYPQIRGFAIDMTGTPTTGNQIQVINTGFAFTVDDILIKNCWVGLVVQGTSNAARTSIGYVTNLKVWNFRFIGIYLQFVNDIFFQNTLVYQKDIGFNVGSYALYLSDNCEAINFDSADFVGGAYSLLMTSATPGTHGQRPAYNAFNACYFDSAANGSLIQAGVLNSFTNCWFSTGGLGGVATATGIDIVTCDSLLFTNCRFHTNARHGAVVESGGLRVGFVNCTFEDNSVLAAAHAGHGLVLADSANGVSVFGGFARNGDLPSAQGYGIFIGTGVTNVTINGVDVNGNFTGGLTSATQIGSTTCSVKDCKGFVSEARGLSTIPNGAAGLTVAHGLGGTPQTVMCTLMDNGTGAQAIGSGLPRVHTVGTVNFTYDIGVVATANRPFSWEAKL